MEPGAAQRRLDPLVGEWATTGSVWAAPGAEPVGFTASDVYEWLPGGFFLAHHVKAEMPDGEVVALELARPDGDEYVLSSYDNRGGFAESRARMEESRWLIRADTERFDGVFSPDGDVVEGTWQRLLDGDWVRWMEVRLVRAGLAAR